MEACRKVCVPRVPSCSPPRRCPHRTTCPPTDLGSRNAVPPLIRSALILTHATHRPTVCTLTCACFFSSSGLWLHHGNVRLPSSQRTAAPIALAPPGGSRSHLRAQRAVPQAGLCVQHQHRQCPIRPASGCVRKRCSRGGPGLDCTRPRTHSHTLSLSRPLLAPSGTRGWNRVELHHRSLRRVPHGQNAAVPHPLRDRAVAARHVRHAGAPHLSTSLPRARSPDSSLLARSRNGGNGKVFYIDTEGTFRPDRMRPIAERFGMDPDGVLDNIIYARMHTHDQQMEIMTAVAAKIAEDAVNYSLMVRLLPRILCTHPSPAPRPPPTPILPLAPDRGQRDGAVPRRLQRPRRALGAAAKAGQAPVQHYQECAGAARFGVDAGLTPSARSRRGVQHRRAAGEPGVRRPRGDGRVRKRPEEAGGRKRASESGPISLRRRRARPGALAPRDALPARRAQILAHASTTRLMLRKGAGDQRIWCVPGRGITPLHMALMAPI